MVNKTISLSLETFNNLKTELNASALIERLCRNYFDANNSKNMSAEDRKKKIASLKVEIEAAKKAEEIIHGNIGT